MTPPQSAPYRHFAMSRLSPPWLSSSALLLALPLLPSGAMAQIQVEATQAEVCPSPSFGTIPPANAFANRCVKVTNNIPTSKAMFWVPAIRRRPPGNCSTPTGDLTAAIPSGIASFTILNLDSARRLIVNGSNADDILVGSPGTNDVLQGGGGRNTYITGGLSTTLVVTPPDQVKTLTISSRIETDLLTLGDNSEFIYINPGAGQANPGTIIVPSGATVTVRGSGAVPTSLRPTTTSPSPECLSSAPNFALPPANRFPLLALADPAASGPGLGSFSPAISGDSGRIAAGDPQGYAPCSSLFCRQPASVPAVRQFPGAPTLLGFGLTAGNSDRIFVPAADLKFQGQLISEAFPPGKSIPMLVVNAGRFLAPEVANPETVKRMRKGSRGLSRVTSTTAPLVYFRQNGLLVFSRNGEPLGSESNPGLVISVLLDRQGKPIALPSSGEPSLYHARFLSFIPPQSNPYTNPPR